MTEHPRIPIQRVQTGVRIEKSLLKVLKGLAEYCEISMGDLLEGIVLHSFEGKPPFSPETIPKASPSAFCDSPRSVRRARKRAPTCTSMGL